MVLQKNFQILPKFCGNFSDFSPLFRFTGKLEIIKPLRSAKRKRRRRRSGGETLRIQSLLKGRRSLWCRGDMRKMGAAGEKRGQGGKVDERGIGGKVLLVV